MIGAIFLWVLNNKQINLMILTSKILVKKINKVKNNKIFNLNFHRITKNLI